MFSKMLDSIPVLGHAKGILHYVTGDFQGGNRAMYEATRSTAVMAGGVVGAVGGPVGMAAGAVAAGAVADLFTSGVTGNAEGVLAGVNGMINEISNGEFPTNSILHLTVCVGGDAIGGIGGGSIYLVGKSVVKKVGKEVIKTVIKEEAVVLTQAVITHTLARITVEDTTESQKSSGSKSQPTPTPTNAHTSRPKNDNRQTTAKSRDTIENTSGSGSQPPEKNQNTPKKEHQITDTHWDALFKIFNVNSLDDICMGVGNIALFKAIGDGQKKTLKKLISALRRNGDTFFSRIIRIVVKLFDKFEDKDVTFQYFIGLVQFVLTYIGEEVAQRNDLASSTNDTQYGSTFDERLKQLRDDVALEVMNDTSDIWYKFKSLKQVILNELSCIWPTFRDVVAAVYHYYKHRFVPEQSGILSVEEYFKLINSLLVRLTSLDQFFQLSPTRREMVFERYIRVYRRRLKIVVKVQEKPDAEGKIHIELSSCYFLSVFIDGDDDGDEYLDGKKL